MMRVELLISGPETLPSRVTSCDVGAGQPRQGMQQVPTQQKREPCTEQNQGNLPTINHDFSNDDG